MKFAILRTKENYKEVNKWFNENQNVTIFKGSSQCYLNFPSKNGYFFKCFSVYGICKDYRLIKNILYSKNERGI